MTQSAPTRRQPAPVVAVETASSKRLFTQCTYFKVHANHPAVLTSNLATHYHRIVFCLTSLQVLAAVRSGLLVVGGTTSEQTVGTVAASETSVADIPAMLVGAPGHADILREASHYLSAIKVCACVSCFRIKLGG